MNTQKKSNTMPNSRRGLALAAGIIYLLTFVSIPTLSLYGAIHEPNYIVGAGPDTPALIGIVLEIIVALGCFGTAAALYPVLKKQNEALALGFVGARILEAATIFAGIACLLTIVSMRQAGVGADAAVIGTMLATMYDRIFLFGQSFMPGVNDILLGLLLYQTRLVPRHLSLIGLFGGVLLIAGDFAVLFGLIAQHAPSTLMLAIPVAVFEFSLGIWLVVKGFNPSAIATLESKT